MRRLLLADVPVEDRRSFDALAQAFREAARAPVDVGALAALIAREHEIDDVTTRLAFRSLLGLLARKTGETPRELLDREFTHAPSDEFWRASVGGRA